MIKFRGNVKWNGLHFFSGEEVDGELTFNEEYETCLRVAEWDHLGNVERSGVVQVESTSLQINVAGHWLDMDELEIIVGKYMGKAKSE